MDANETRLIDSHLHIWTRDMPLTDTAWHSPPTQAPLEACLKTLDEHNVMFAVVAAASIHGEYNDYSRAALKMHKRLRATAVLDPDTDIYQMERMQADGFVGVRLMWSLSDTVPEIDTGVYRMFLRRIADLGWHVHLVDRPERMARSIAAVEASGARLVIDHMGHLQTPEGVNNEGFKAMLQAMERGNTWVKISGRFRFEPPESGDQYAAQLLKYGAGDRVLWGSDWPFAAFEETMTYRRALEDFAHLVPDERMRRKIDETGLRFYFM